MIDLAELQKEVHALARAKGFYDNRDMDNPDTIDSMIELIHSEISEATECVRREEMALEYEYDGVRQGEPHWPALLAKPVGFPSELADVVLRCLDLAEALNMEPLDIHFDSPRPNCSTPTAIVARLREARKDFERSNDFGESRVDHVDLEILVEWMFDIALARDIDLLEVCCLKHEYNKTRTIRHGKVL